MKSDNFGYTIKNSRHMNKWYKLIKIFLKDVGSRLYERIVVIFLK